MSAEFDFLRDIRGEAPPGTAFANFVAMHGLRTMLVSLDSLKREELLNWTRGIILPDYEAPEGTSVEVVANGRSQETPLPIEVCDPIDPEWLAVRPDSPAYEESVSSVRNGMDQKFSGSLIRQDSASGELYVYQKDREVRVHLSPLVTFRRVDEPSA